MNKISRIFNGGNTVNIKLPDMPKRILVSRPTNEQVKWLQRGLDQAGGKLPLFDDNGQKISSRTINACLKKGWAEPWFSNPIKPDWLVCKLTKKGKRALEQK